MSCLQKNKRKINAAYQCTRPMKITAIQSSLLRDRSLFTGGGEGYYFFEKWLEKNMTLPFNMTKKIMTFPRRRVKKIVTLPLSLFFIFI